MTLLTDPLKPCQLTGPRDGTKQACTSDHDGLPSLTSIIIFLILTANCGAAVYHSRNDPWAMAFVLASFLILLLLFVALRLFEMLPRESPWRAHIKAAVWVLSTALTLMFSQRVASIMPFPAAVLVWVMAVSTISAGFYMFFICPDGATTAEEPAKVADIP
ncbi:hypothetical protein PR202_gb04989 [Eleusine coracana subsp. coracana]|uniref:Uncharacterized protein n=1 Tax=Eleusine coracana subsp. coracana TaxID=191504 RepID=A0AAV5E561_ELECO|nr:hypothetical protein PR202_gb04989 [Eleusine coracana subsp. coracana]